MTIPPGPLHLLQLTPQLLLPSAVIYVLLRLSVELCDLSIPFWLVIILTVLSKPALVILTKYYCWLRDLRLAKINNAILVPSVPEPGLSIISELTESIRSGYPAEVMLRWSEQYGNIVRFDTMAFNGVSTVEPDHIKAILATQFESFEKGPMFRAQMDSLLGSGIFNADGTMWKFHRSITRPFFTRERIIDFEIYERNCDLSLNEARKRVAEGYSVDFQDLVSRFTLDSATEFLFGSTVGSLSAGIPYPPLSSLKNSPAFYNHPSSVFVKAFTEGQVRTSLRYSLGTDWPLGPDFWGNKVAPLRKTMDDFTEPLIEEALSKRERDSHTDLSDKSEKGQEASLLANLVNQTQDPKILKDELINLLVAGRDTTMCLLAFAFYMLSEHPEVELRLRQEIFEKVGPNNSPTYDHMREMKYMRAFLNEVLRLYPPVPLNNRTTNEPVILPNNKAGEKPFYVPANTMIFYTVINLHRRTDLWGPDALKFDPDRFLDERLHKYLTPNPYIFCPFNAGPRICLGQQFAYHEATYYLTRLLQQFTGFTLDDSTNIKPPSEWAHCGGRKATEKVHPMSHLTMYIKGGLWVKMREFATSEV